MLLLVICGGINSSKFLYWNILTVLSPYPANLRCLSKISIRSPLRETSQRPLRNILKEITFL